MAKKFLCYLIAILLLLGLSSPVTATKADDNPIVDAMIRIPARPDFSFRYDLTNKATGESAPITEAYYLSAYKVTNAQYKAFIDATGHKAPNYWSNGTYPAGKAEHPVLNVSYSDAVSYCSWLSSQYENWDFRLPTEAEWENAAMGSYYDDTSVKYPHGAQAPAYSAATGNLTTQFNYNGVIAAKLFTEYGSDHIVNYIKGDFAGTSEPLGQCISISSTGGVSNWANHGSEATKGYFLQTDLYAQVSADGGHTTPVGSYPANTLGLYDMAGNCWDLTSSVITAVNGLESGVDCYAVRGGSWYATARSCTFYYRGEGRKDSPSSTVGFRIAADAPADRNGWVQTQAGWVYYDNNQMVTNRWVRDSVGWCYVGNDGYCVTNTWKKDSVGWCYLDANGRMAQNKWIKDSVGWCYVGNDGYCVTNTWKKDSVGWCYLDANGRMAQNKWIKDSIGWCYVGNDGYCVTNTWKKDSVGWCYLDANGRMVQSNWVRDGSWYYLDDSGYMVTGIQTIHNETHRFDNAGRWLGKLS